MLNTASFGQGTIPIAISSVGCAGNEATLLDCPYHASSCSHSQDAGVRCHVRTGKCNSTRKRVILLINCQIDCSDGDIRLEGSSRSLQGRVEVCYDGVWGTVCNSLWNKADATVVCRQLGYSSSGKY